MADPTGTNSAQSGTFEAVLGLKGQALAVGAYADIEIPFNCSLFVATALGDAVGSATVDIRTCTEAQFDAGVTHPVAGDSITGGNPLTIATATKAQDPVLAGWARSLLAGTIARLVLTSVTTLTQITVSLKVFR